MLRPDKSLRWMTESIGIGTGDGLLAVNRLQSEGRRPSDAQDFVRGYPDFVGVELGRSS